MLAAILTITSLIAIIFIVYIALSKKNVKKFSINFSFPFSLCIKWETQNDTSHEKNTASNAPQTKTSTDCQS